MTVGQRKRNRAEREFDRREMAALYLRGMTQQEIADHVNTDKKRKYTLSQQQVSYDLLKIQEHWREATVMDLTEAKTIELARIDALEREYWAAWEKSCGPERTTRQEGVPIRGLDGKLKEEPQIIKIIQSSRASSGNSAFLRGVQECIKMRITLLGLDAPIKHDVRNFDLDMSKLTDEQLRRVAAGEDPIDIADEAVQ